jgi:hypothetical protein
MPAPEKRAGAKTNFILAPSIDKIYLLIDFSAIF